MGFADGYLKKVTNEFNDLKNRFAHDFITMNYKGSVVCRVCKKEFNRLDLDKADKTEFATCFVRYNEWLKEQREQAMVKMLGKYFCIWKV